MSKTDQILDQTLKQPVFWLLLICAVNFFAFLGGHTLWDVDEPNNAVCAREMLLAGNWWIPMFNGDYRFDKPILIYWLMMPIDAMFGAHEWSARLPSALSLTALVLVVWGMTRRLMVAADTGLKERTALMAAGMFATALHMIVIGRAAVPDPLLMLCMGIALPALLITYIEHRSDKANKAEQKNGLNKGSNKGGSKKMPPMLLLAFVAIGFGTLAKGPIAGLMPLLIVAAFLTLMGDWKNWRVFHPFKGAAIALAVALPWYVAVGILTDGVWLEGFLFHHNLDRFTDSLQGHHGFPGLYIVSIMAGWFPWTGLLAAMLWFGSWRLKVLRDEPVRMFMLCWIGMYIVFFSIASTQLPNYVLPVFPAAAMLMAWGWAGSTQVLRQKSLLWLAWVALLMSLGILIGGGLALEKMGDGEGILILSMLPMLLVSAWWLLAGWQPAGWLSKKQGDLRLLLVAGMALSMLLLVGWSIKGIDHHKASHGLALKATEAGFDGSELATFRYFQPSLLFYHGGRLPLFNDVQQVGVWMAAGKAVVMPQYALEELPKEIVPYLIVHARMHSMYARTWLLLVSLQPVNKLNSIVAGEEEIKW